jgi:undecaprenyl-diphosphatase
MDFIEAFLLGIVQGLTEFLPVSSSGHLVLAESLLGVETPGIIFEVAVHLATAGAVVLAYRNRIRSIFQSVPLVYKPRLWKRAAAGDESQLAVRENFLLGCCLVLGTIPAAVIGLLFKESVERAFDSPDFVCFMLIVTGLILVSSRLAPEDSTRTLSWWRVLLIGLAQSMALLPGISRSGATITAALLLGIPPGRAAEFSFLLALPAILGATVFELASLFASGLSNLPVLWAILAGVVAAFFSGFTAIFFVLKALQKGRFDRFAWYCWAVGISGLLLL